MRARTVLRLSLIEALRRTKWNITRTAVLLGLSRNTVRARIQRYGLRSPEALAQSTSTDAPSRISSSSSQAVPTGLVDVRVYTLGRFAVFVGNLPILEDSPQNAPARQQLKLLVTRRGHRVPDGPGLEPGAPTLDAQPDRLPSAMS